MDFALLFRARPLSGGLCDSHEHNVESTATDCSELPLDGSVGKTHKTCGNIATESKALKDQAIPRFLPRVRVPSRAAACGHFLMPRKHTQDTSECIGPVSLASFAPLDRIIYALIYLS